MNATTLAVWNWGKEFGQVKLRKLTLIVVHSGVKVEREKRREEENAKAQNKSPNRKSYDLWYTYLLKSKQ
jgi:hypothetical protein